jgi:ribosomal-protein-alanine N-acetyltransferase
MLETERLILRDFDVKDWDVLNAIVSDPEVTRFMHFASWDEVKRREWFARLVQDAGKQAREGYNWAITLRSNGMLIGWFFIGGPPRDRGCGYALDRRFWGQGYMPEAARAIFAYEFTVLGTLRIFAECETPNTASARVMQKSGMLYEETSLQCRLRGQLGHAPSLCHQQAGLGGRFQGGKVTLNNFY